MREFNQFTHKTQSPSIVYYNSMVYFRFSDCSINKKQFQYNIKRMKDSKMRQLLPATIKEH